MLNMTPIQEAVTGGNNSAISANASRRSLSSIRLSIAATSQSWKRTGTAPPRPRWTTLSAGLSAAGLRSGEHTSVCSARRRHFPSSSGITHFTEVMMFLGCRSGAWSVGSRRGSARHRDSDEPAIPPGRRALASGPSPRLDRRSRNAGALLGSRSAQRAVTGTLRDILVSVNHFRLGVSRSLRAKLTDIQFLWDFTLPLLDFDLGETS
jgi:hypothetical protein